MTGHIYIVFSPSNAASMKVISVLQIQHLEMGEWLQLGEENFIMDLPSRLFGSNLSWFCKNDTDLLKNFNKISLCKIRPLGLSSDFPTR